MEFLRIEQLQIIILAGAIIALIARRLKIPYTVGLVTAGLLVSFLSLPLDVNFSKDLLFKVLLPPLIFEAALYIKWSELRRDISLIIVYATVGVVLSAGVTAAFMHYAAAWSVAALLCVAFIAANAAV